MKRKVLAILLSLLLVAMMLAGCGGGQNGGGSGSSGGGNNGGGASDTKVAVIFGVGGLGDQSFNDLVYEGLQKAKSELGVDFDYAEPKQVTEFETLMSSMSSSEDYAVILCIGFDQQDALTKVAPQFPDQAFALIDGTVEGDNIVCYNSLEHEGSFLVGALAALIKQDAATYNLLDNNELGFVGAMENDLIVRFAAGYRAGAQYIDPDMNVTVQYVGGDNPFGDTTTAAEISRSQFEKGCDIIYHAAGGSGMGVFNAAKENSFYAIGCNSNQNTIDPDHIIASMLKRVDSAAYEIAKAAQEGTLSLGQNVELGLSDEGVGYTVEGSNIQVSQDIIEQLEEIKGKIISGEIKVPETL